MKPLIDPRHGDLEDDASSTKRRSLLSLAGSLLAEISLPKLALSWTLLFLVPGLLLGLAPLVVSAWVSLVKNKIASPLIGIWPALLLMVVLAAGLFGARSLLRMAENSFWSLNSLAVEPVYVRAGKVCGILPKNFCDRALEGLNLPCCGLLSQVRLA